RSPRLGEERDRDEPGEVQAENDEDDAADDPERREVLGEAGGGERRGDPKQREDAPEAEDVGERMSERQPAVGLGAALATGDGDGGQLAEVGRDQRQDTRRQERDEARGDGDE